MKVFDKKFAIAFSLTFLFLIGMLVTGVNSSYAAPVLGVPEITSFKASDLEKNALKLEYKTNNTGTDFSIEVVEATTKTTKNLSGSVTSYTFQNLTEGTEYKVQVRACTNSSTKYECSDWSSVSTAIAGAEFTDIKSVKLNKSQFVYTGKTKTPTVTVKDKNDATLTKGQDYTVTLPKKRTAIGKYEVTVKGKGNYSFTKKLSFTINPPKPTISKVTSTKNSITVKWKKAKGGVKYQVGYKKASASKYKYTKNISSTSKKITGLKAGTKYKVVVRCYKKVNKQDFIGANSAAKTKSTTGKAKSSSSGGSTNSGGGSTNSGGGSNNDNNDPPENPSKVTTGKNKCTSSGGTWKNSKCTCGTNQKLNSGGKCVCKSKKYVRLNSKSACVLKAQIDCNKNRSKKWIDGKCKTLTCVSKKKKGYFAVYDTEVTVYKIDKCTRVKASVYTVRVGGSKYNYVWKPTGTNTTNKKNSGMKCDDDHVNQIRAVAKSGTKKVVKYCKYK